MNVQDLNIEDLLGLVSKRQRAYFVHVLRDLLLRDHIFSPALLTGEKKLKLAHGSSVADISAAINKVTNRTDYGGMIWMAADGVGLSMDYETPLADREKTLLGALDAEIPSEGLNSGDIEKWLSEVSDKGERLRQRRWDAEHGGLWNTIRGRNPHIHPLSGAWAYKEQMRVRAALIVVLVVAVLRVSAAAEQAAAYLRGVE